MIGQMDEVRFGQWLKAGRKQACVGVLFVITYHLGLKKITQIMKKLDYLLHQNESVKQVFTPPPMVSYCKGRKLSSFFVHAKLYLQKAKENPVSVGIRDIKFATTLTD